MGKKWSLMKKVLMMIPNTNHLSIIKKTKIWRFGMRRKILFKLIKWKIKKRENLRSSQIKSIPRHQLFNRVKNLLILNKMKISQKD